MYAKDTSGRAITGTLMGVEEDPNARFKFQIWFDYTRAIMNTLSEGAMVAVPNYYLGGDSKRKEFMSVLEISTVLPMHYALGDTKSGFPGFLVEAARSAGQDWIDQETESHDDTTKIRCIAIPTNLQIDDDGTLSEEEGLPMVGHQAHLLDTATTEMIANLNIDSKKDDVTVVGPLIRDKDVRVFVRNEEMLRTHFAIFGFTGAGKSNLLSSLIAQLLERPSDRPALKIVVFDLMGEFTALLMDKLVTLPNARVVAVGPESLPDAVLSAHSTDKPTDEALEKAADQLARTSLYPKGLKDLREDFVAAFKTLLKANKVRVYQEQEATIGNFVALTSGDYLRGGMGNDSPTVAQIIATLEKDFAKDSFRDNDAIARAITAIEAVSVKTATARRNVKALLDAIKSEALEERPIAPKGIRVSIPDIVDRLNEDKSSSLVVVQAANPDQLRTFAALLGNALYQKRRRAGQISPLVSFVFDEADEFIPLQPPADSSYADSTHIAMTLARRGRKFGLGLGLATQRVTYLNTSIMAQPHTYFLSKLPRRSDRERISEAFGISEEMFRQTFKFKKGNWLLVSHDATGLDAVPLPIKTPNAEERIKAWFTK